MILRLKRVSGQVKGVIWMIEREEGVLTDYYPVSGGKSCS